MEAHLRLPLITLKVDGASQKELFRNLASATEVFGESECGICGSKNIRIVWRTVMKQEGRQMKNYEYPEWHCMQPDCRARLAMSLNNDNSGTLYPKRALEKGTGRPLKVSEDKKGADYSTNGWSKFKGKDNDD